ncbi:FHA domain-containing protein [Planctomicrobium sp.]|nr:FHA domain-containing protein [Planctomicrobium sp.]MBT5019367.1 FHA domain-containing protein [Planctomicrobium sp.]MDA7527729.1 FHA domain-containing protein [bacterium]MDB4743796.1 FHA domain-containing protein [Planctomicrobium sp.]MDB4802373.1 FHA domain-containing protein [bacterium]
MSKTHLLEIQTGRHKGRKIRLTDVETIIGRGEDAKIRISSDDVSRHHCILTVRNNDVLVKDLVSRNGTFVNGRPIEGEIILKPGGTLAVGPMVLRLMGDADDSSNKDVKITVKSPSQIEEPLSDDDIAAWLTSEIDQNQLESDTATYDVPKVKPKSKKETVDTSAKPRRKEFASIAEEAKDIIRRHLESLAEDSE